MIRAPKHDGDWPNRALDCEIAMEDAFLAIAERLQTAGLSLEETAELLIAGAADAGHWIGEDLRQVAAWAVHAGWRKTEVAYAIVNLAENFRLSIEERGKTEKAVRLARGEPE